MMSRAERRGDYVLFVRDWITELRCQGGDFSPAAARTANMRALAALEAGHDPDTIFRIARAAYYSVLWSSETDQRSPSRPPVEPTMMEVA